MNVSAPFIARPVATWLLAVGVASGKGPTYIAYYMMLLVVITVVSVSFAKETNKDVDIS